MKTLVHVPHSHKEFWDSLQKAFLNNGKVWDESTRTSADRWQMIEEYIPEISNEGLCLYEDLTPIYLDYYYRAKNNELLAVIDLCMLQWRFLSVVANNNLGLKHVADYHIVNVYYWQKQLRDKVDYPEYRLKVNQIDDEGRDIGYPILEKDEDPEPIVEHPWLN